MPNFLETVERFKRMNILHPVYRGTLPPRAFLNPRDFKNGKAPGTAYVAPEYPKWAPPEWQAGVLEYISEDECEKIFAEHFKNLSTQTWDDFAFDFGKAEAVVLTERKRARRTRRNKRAFHFWSGYAMGLKVAFSVARRFFKH